MCKDWATVKYTVKSLEHIIMKCDPPTPAMPTMATGATVPGLYSHIAHSVDKEEGAKFFCLFLWLCILLIPLSCAVLGNVVRGALGTVQGLMFYRSKDN